MYICTNCKIEGIADLHCIFFKAHYYPTGSCSIARLEAEGIGVVEPKCYACSAPATTRCQKCNAFSCVQHLSTVDVVSAYEGGPQLRCSDCRTAAESEKRNRRLLIVAVLLVFPIILFIQHSCNEARWEQRMNEQRQESEPAAQCQAEY